jgi:formylglycine-generating enzyme required for sulfatase activity
MFERDNREGRSLAAAVELAEELRRRGQQEAGDLLDAFCSEAANEREDMVEVETGAFPYGPTNEFVELAAFAIDRHPVTNEQYERMLSGDRKLRLPVSGTDMQPIIFVNWFEARLYARWRGRGCRLPSEQEWEKAAGWDANSQKKRVYPWGDDFDMARCNTGESRTGKTTSVDAYPAGASASGAWDMAGNVWEWTDSLWNEGSEARVLRGGSSQDISGYAACVCRFNLDPGDRHISVGFRCART